VTTPDASAIGIGALSKATGIPVETLRTWERRYGAVVPVRDERGRVYTDADVRRIRLLRDRLWQAIGSMEEVYLNGDLEQRIPGNINVSFNYVEGESLIMAIKDIAVSSGSACTSASLEPSYVLRALGRSDELAHSSIRLTLGKYTTEEEVDYAADLIKRKVAKLRELSPLWEMHKDGVDVSKVQWAAH